MPRILPSLENLLRLLQPTKIIVYVPSPSKVKKNILEYLIKTKLPNQGKMALQIMIKIMKINIGLKVKRTQ